MSVIIRDKGLIPLPNPDVKIRSKVDQETGFALLLCADLPAHLAVYWWQPTGWSPPIHWGEVNINDFDLLIHDHHVKMVVRTWGRGDGPPVDIPEKHAVILDLGALPS